MTRICQFETHSDEQIALSNSSRGDFLAGLFIWVILVGWSLIRVPIPGTNETHYWTKARHFWEPAWCAGDPFLESSNPHFLFYMTFGALTNVLDMPQAVCVGRILGLMVVAAGWLRVGRAVTGSEWSALAALFPFMLLHSLGNWSGEWLVGGSESKVPAYGCLLFGLGCWLEGKRISAVACVGWAIGYHPIIGLWGLMGILFSSVLSQFLPEANGCDEQPPARIHGTQSRCWIWASLGCLSGVLAALAGLIPSLAMLLESTPRKSLEATYIQFAGRLSHHLDPMQFPAESHRYFGMQLLVWSLLLVLDQRSEARQRWNAFIFGTLLMAGVGVLLAIGPRPVKLMPGWEWRIGLLKFYPFRMADLMLPVAIAFLFGSLARFTLKASRWQVGRNVFLLAVCGLAALWVPGPDSNPSRMSPDRLRRWVAALNWVHEHTSSEDVLYCYDEQYAVRWYAQRPEYVNYKDCPQDARSLLEWNKRLWNITDWNRKSFLYGDGVFRAAELEQLYRQTQIKTLVVSRRIRVEMPAAYSNRDFAVYLLSRP